MPFAAMNQWQLQMVTDSTVPPVVLIVLYFIGTMLTISNYVAYVRFNVAIYGNDLVRTYLAFTILGTAAYGLVAAVSWLWAAKYVTTSGQRLQKIAIGLMVIFLFHDLPIFAMDWHMVLCCGWRNAFQGFCFIKQIMLFFVSFIFGWTGYAYVASGFLNRAYGDPLPELKTGSEMVVVLPRNESVGFGSPAGFSDRTLDAPLLPRTPTVRGAFVDERGGVKWTDDQRVYSEQQPALRSLSGQQQGVSSSSYPPSRDPEPVYATQAHVMDPITRSSMHLMGAVPQDQPPAGGGLRFGSRQRSDDEYSEPDVYNPRPYQRGGSVGGLRYYDDNPMYRAASGPRVEYHDAPFVPRGGGSIYVERHQI